MNTLTGTEQKRKFWGRMIWISALSMVLTICAGAALPAIRITNALNALKATGTAHPSELASEISKAIMLGMLALPFAFAALVLFIIAILRHRKFSNQTQAS